MLQLTQPEVISEEEATRVLADRLPEIIEVIKDAIKYTNENYFKDYHRLGKSAYYHALNAVIKSFIKEHFDGKQGYKVDERRNNVFLLVEDIIKFRFNKLKKSYQIANKKAQENMNIEKTIQLKFDFGEGFNMPTELVFGYNPSNNGFLSIDFRIVCSVGKELKWSWDIELDIVNNNAIITPMPKKQTQNKEKNKKFSIKEEYKEAKKEKRNGKKR